MDLIIFFFKLTQVKQLEDMTSRKRNGRSDVRKYSFSKRTVNEWNKLSADRVHSSSILRT